MTLGTGEPPWTAPVYYLYDRGRFYFFSNPASRHICQGLGRPCAAAIHRDAPSFSELEGIQMAGTICQSRSVRAAAAYCARFGIPGSQENLLEFFLARFHARLYFLEPDQVLYMNNAAAFGNRESIYL